MARYLIVAHETAANPRLKLCARAVTLGDSSAEFVLLVPATPVRHLLRTRAREGEAGNVARKRADEAKEQLVRAGVRLVDARVGAASPVDAIVDELRSNPGYAGVIISTLPAERSHWLRLDLPTKVREELGCSVLHVEATPEDVQSMLNMLTE